MIAEKEKSRSSFNNDMVEADDAPSPTQSSYSSCDDSEYEKYCSANSVLGTPSICSSVDDCSEYLDLDSDLSFRQRRLKVGRSNELDDASVSGSSVSSLTRDKNSGIGKLHDKIVSMEGSNLVREFTNAVNSSTDNFRNSLATSAPLQGERKDPYTLQGSIDQRQGSLDIVPHKSVKLAFRQSKSMKYDKHGFYDGGSDGEDPMLNYGMDDEKRFFAHRGGELSKQKEHGSSLFMNSSVAFGANDWDEFEHESGEVIPLSMEMMNPLETFHRDFVNGSGNLVPKIQAQSSGQHALYNTGDNLKHSATKGERTGDVHFSSLHTQAIDGIPSLKSEDKSSNLENQYEAHADPWKVAKNKSGGTFLMERDSFDDFLPDIHPLEETDAPGSSLNGVHLGIDDRVLEKVRHVPGEEVRSSIWAPGTNHPSDLATSTSLSGFDSSSSEASTRKEFGVLAIERRNEVPVTKGIKESTSKQVLAEDGLATLQVDKLSEEYYDDMVLDMEAVLLESAEPHGISSPETDQSFPSHENLYNRDGSSTASTSGVDDAHRLNLRPKRVDWVEVVAAKHKKGEISFGERLVGVKEYTVYVIRVWSGKEQWEVERRYRDFFALYRQLKKSFADHGLRLPSAWTDIDRESRKIFGSATPDAITERSTLIQECLRSILYAETLIPLPSSLIWFLSRDATDYGSLSTNSAYQSIEISKGISSSYYHGTSGDSISDRGKTISLVVELHPHKSLRQLLDAQHYSCADCHKPLDVGKTFVQGFAQSLGWRKPRLCEYTGQLFCASCHSNDTAVLPARVLQHWDFSLCSVSQLAKAYLDSIYDQPMLCVSAVNPYLFTKVPPLLHIMGIRKKIAAMTACVRCPFGRSIQKTLGSRKYLLVENDFFALRDLVDVSKGAFAALPMLMETLSKKILDHITQQCLVCCDGGEPCNARLNCDDPVSLIFPFQLDDAAHCTSCGLVFHRNCFEKLSSCPCGVVPPERMLRANSMDAAAQRTSGLTKSMLDLSSIPAKEMLSNLFSKVRIESPWRNRSSPVILMGSLSGPSD